MAKETDHKNPAWGRMEKGQDSQFSGYSWPRERSWQYACLLQVCVCTNPESCFRCCPWLASQPFIQFSFQTHLLCLFLPRTDRSHLSVDITSSLHLFQSHLCIPTGWALSFGACRTSALVSTFCKQQLNLELWVPWLACVPRDSHLPTWSQPPPGAASLV